MYHKDDLIVGFNLLDCQIIKIEGNEYTLECIHCHKLYKYDYDKLRRRKTNFCKLTYEWTKTMKEENFQNKNMGNILYTGNAIVQNVEMNLIKVQMN